MRNKNDLDALLWNLLGTGERFVNGEKKLIRYYRQLMQWKVREQEAKRRREKTTHHGDANANT
jgi:hypothetical protein